MERLAGCLLVFGIITMIFSPILYYNWITLMPLPRLGIALGYGLLIAGMSCISASYFLVVYKRQTGSKKEVEAGGKNEASGIVNLTEASIGHSDPVKVVQQVQKQQPAQRTRVHIEIIMQLQLEYGTKQFRTRDAIKLIEERINADATTTRFALHWGQTQGQIVKLGHGLYQCLEPAHNIHFAKSVAPQVSQNPNTTFDG